MLIVLYRPIYKINTQKHTSALLYTVRCATAKTRRRVKKLKENDRQTREEPTKHERMEIWEKRTKERKGRKKDRKEKTNTPAERQK